MGGVDSKHFAPDESCTRAQAVTMLWRADGCPEVWMESPFTDIDANDYYYEAVLWVVANGITSGSDEAHFKPRRALYTLPDCNLPAQSCSVLSGA